MNTINRIMSSIFDVALTPFELLGSELALILVSGLFGIVALILFKHISWQAGIKGVKDKIKGNMIAIRIYQDQVALLLELGLEVGQGLVFAHHKYIGRIGITT